MKRACFESGASPYHLLIARFGFALFPMVIFKQSDAMIADENNIGIMNVGVPFAMKQIRSHFSLCCGPAKDSAASRGRLKVTGAQTGEGLGDGSSVATKHFYSRRQRRVCQAKQVGRSDDDERSPCASAGNEVALPIPRQERNST